MFVHFLLPFAVEGWEGLLSWKSPTRKDPAGEEQNEKAGEAWLFHGLDCESYLLASKLLRGRQSGLSDSSFSAAMEK